jgi:hypothetical protein
MANEAEDIQPGNSTNPKSGESKSTTLWALILLAYVVLFCATGYVAFFKYEDNPAVNISPEWIKRFDDPETRKRMLDTLKEDSVMFAKKRELATQSFNVVLGALLGFLSASAVSAARK